MNSVFAGYAAHPVPVPEASGSLVRQIPDMSVHTSTGLMIPMWACTVWSRGHAVFGCIPMGHAPALGDLEFLLETRPDLFSPVATS